MRRSRCACARRAASRPNPARAACCCATATSSAAASSRHVEAAGAQRADNLVPAGHLISSETRAQRNGYRGLVAWFTGLPGSGKSTIAMAVERELFARGYFVYVLDGDNVRAGLNRDLGFTRDGRQENIRRVGEVAALFADAGAIVITGTISPHAVDRADARAAAARCLPRNLHARQRRDVRRARRQRSLRARAGGRIARLHRRLRRPTTSPNIRTCWSTPTPPRSKPASRRSSSTSSRDRSGSPPELRAPAGDAGQVGAGAERRLRCP